MEIPEAHCADQSDEFNQKKLKSKKRKVFDKAYVPKKHYEAENAFNSRYMIKNFESNIVNQIYSFLTTSTKCRAKVSRFFIGKGRN